MKQGQSAEELAKKISILDAIRQIFCAVKDVTSKCIKNYFSKAGIELERCEKSDENLVSILNRFIEDHIDLSEYVNIDENVATKAGYQTLEEKIATKTNDHEDETTTKKKPQVLVLQKLTPG